MSYPFVENWLILTLDEVANETSFTYCELSSTIKKLYDVLCVMGNVPFKNQTKEFVLIVVNNQFR